MNDYWDDMEEKSWGDINDDTLEILNTLNVKPVEIKPKVEFIPPPPKRKQERNPILKWDYVVDINELDNIPLPEKRKHKYPINNGRMLLEFKDAIRYNKMYIKSEKGYICKTGGVYFYIAELGHTYIPHVRQNLDYEFCVGFLNFNNTEQYGCRFLRGETIQGVDEELEIYFRRGFPKCRTIYHTKNAIKTMKFKCRNAIVDFKSYNKVRGGEIKRMKGKKIDDLIFGFFIINLMYRLKNWGVLADSKIQYVVKAYWSNKYPKTLWGLEQTFLSVFQNVRNPSRRLLIFNAVHDILLYILNTPKAKLKIHQQT